MKRRTFFQKYGSRVMILFVLCLMPQSCESSDSSKNIKDGLCKLLSSDDVGKITGVDVAATNSHGFLECTYYVNTVNDKSGTYVGEIPAVTLRMYGHRSLAESKKRWEEILKTTIPDISGVEDQAFFWRGSKLFHTPFLYWVKDKMLFFLNLEMGSRYYEYDESKLRIILTKLANKVNNNFVKDPITWHMKWQKWLEEEKAKSEAK
jgi:hypothetical protein